jgi:hypothetical protein
VDHADDFSPILEQDTLEAASGMLGRIMRRRELPAVGVGVELVLADKDGKPVAGGKQISGGEKYWAKATSWIKVDVAEHALDFKVSFPDPTGRAGFIATVTVTAAVVDSSKVAASAIASVKGVLEPILNEAVANCASTIKPSSGSDPVATLNEARRVAEAALRTSMRENFTGVPTWLSAQVNAINVIFDDATKRHYDDLVKRAREGELIDATADNKERETSHAIELRNQWREALVDHLSDPATRSFEVVFSDPSPQNIARVVDQVNATDAVARERVFHVLSSLIDNDHLHKTSELSEMMKEIRASLRIGEGRGEPPALAESVERPAIEAEAHTVEHTGSGTSDAQDGT